MTDEQRLDALLPAKEAHIAEQQMRAQEAAFTRTTQRQASPRRGKRPLAELRGKRTLGLLSRIRPSPRREIVRQAAERLWDTYFFVTGFVTRDSPPIDIDYQLIYKTDTDVVIDRLKVINDSINWVAREIEAQQDRLRSHIFDAAMEMISQLEAESQVVVNGELDERYLFVNIRGYMAIRKTPDIIDYLG